MVRFGRITRMAASNQALAVGVSDYPPVIGALPGVANDVREVGRLLQDPGGGFPAGVRVLTDGGATQAAILSALRDAFSADAGATVFVYLAGHGAAAGEDFYFLPIDANPADLQRTCVPLDEVRRLFEECPSERVLLFLDCCHSGGIIPRRLSATPPTAEQAREAMRRTLSIVHGKREADLRRVYARAVCIRKPGRAARLLHARAGAWTPGSGRRKGPQGHGQLAVRLHRHHVLRRGAARFDTCGDVAESRASLRPTSPNSIGS